MKVNRNGRWLVLIVLIAALALVVTPAFGAPDYQGNLLQNPGFENGTYTQAANVEAPTGWTAWWVTQDGGTTPTSCQLWYQPTFKLNGGSGVPHSGTYAANYYTLWAAHNAGLYQKVTGVTAGTVYKFSIYGYSVSRAQSDANSVSATNMWVGIDPTGGTDASSGNIVWSGPYNIQNNHGLMEVQATASGDAVTVFTRSQPIWCMDHNDSFWDDASLLATGQAPAATATTGSGQSTGGNQQSSDYKIATPDANGRIVHTVQTGDTLSGIAYTYGVTVQQIKDLNGLTNNIAVLGVRLVIKTGDETPEPAATEEPPAETGDTGGEQQPADSGTGDQVAEAGGEEQPAAATASICVTTYADVNSNGIRESEEAKVPNISFVLNDGSETIGTYTTTEANDFYCFEGLTPGQYVVTWTGENYTPTTEQTWTVDVSEGAILQREFGMQPAGAAATGGTAAQADTSINGEGKEGGLPTWLTALIGAVAVVVFLSGVGAVGYFVLIRRQQKV